LNNWKAVGYIFLGWGSVFLIYALIVFFSMTSIFSAIPSLAQTTIALAASAPWLIIASLTYVVGVVGYYAGRENAATSDEANVEEMQESSQPVSSKIDSLWSFPVGALTALGILVLQGALGFWNDSDLIFGVALPIFYSIVAGSIVGIVAYFIIPYLD
jgi:hypothetical protein